MLATWILGLWVVGSADRGIFPEYADRITVDSKIPERGKISLRVDKAHGLLTVYNDGEPIKIFHVEVVGGTVGTTVGAVPLKAAGGGTGLILSQEDLAELGARVSASTPIDWKALPAVEDRDRDGIVDRLDILLGAKKLLHNRASYIERYRAIRYPGGDVPRSEGVCTDTIVRALRNAGIDLQKEIHDDMVRQPRVYPAQRLDANINHRRVRTQLPWFQRHFVGLDRTAPYLPGDIVLFDTFASRPGPDHIGIVSDRTGESGQPLIINNWTDGTVDAEMDLLGFVPVTHHFRVK